MSASVNQKHPQESIYLFPFSKYKSVVYPLQLLQPPWMQNFCSTLEDVDTSLFSEKSTNSMAVM